MDKDLFSGSRPFDLSADAATVLSSLNQAQHAIHIRSLEHTILYWNRIAGHVFGWPEKGGDPVRIDADEQQTLAMRTTIEHGRWRGDLAGTSIEGARVTVDSRWTLIRDAGGEPSAVLIIDLDVTEDRLLETQSLQAQRLESIGTLAGGIAHDLNNVLGPILIGAEMIKRRTDDEWINKKLSSIEKSARRGADIVRQVLDFARGAEGELIVMQIRHLLKESVTLAERTFVKAVEIKSEIPDELPMLTGDPMQIKQMMINLMVNAKDAMPGGGTITVGAAHVSLDSAEAVRISADGKSGEYVRIWVRDTGTGISDEDLKKIFDPFFTTKSRSQGTGLGLSTVITIVKAHSGLLDIETEVGKGSTFNLYFPALIEAREDSVSEPAEEETSDEEGEGNCILVVDDEPFVLEMNVEMLESFGYDTLSAENGQEGLEQYKRHTDRIDVVVTDMNMPVMDGPTMIREMRSIDPGVKIVAVSGLPKDQHEAAGADIVEIRILPKPYTSEDLLSEVRTALESDIGKATTTETKTAPDGNELSDTKFDELFGGGDDWT